MADGTGKFDGLPGEAALYNLLPKGYALLSMLAGGIGGAAWGWFQIDANAGAIEQMLKDNGKQADSIGKIHTEQQVQKREFQLYRQEQKRRDDEELERDRENRLLLEKILNDIRQPSR